jgi:starch synthase
MRILLASSEVHPYSKTGGLADMAGALAKALARAGHEVGLVTPLYRGIAARYPDIRPASWEFRLPLGGRTVAADLYERAWAPRLKVLFVRQPDFYERDSLYQTSAGDYGDNAERFLYLCKCVAHLARYHPLRPELVHVHDWQLGFVPLFIRHGAWREGWASAPATCLTIHNLAYQGVFSSWHYQFANLPGDYYNAQGVEFYGSMNCLKTGIQFSDVLTTVSPRYAREIMTEPFGAGLDGVLRARESQLSGILNGVDYSEWKTSGNPHLPYAYHRGNLRGKARNKAALQAELGLPVRSDAPLYANISRLVDQKGSDLILGALEEMISADLQFVLLGSGSAALERAFEGLARRHPEKVAVRIGYDHPLSHRIESGADFFLMPSRFEPCGLNQMYSLRYGTIPIVRRTGGLDDSVTDPGDDVVRADGIKFTEPVPRVLAHAIRKSLILFQDAELLRRFRRSGMERDFSWDRTTDEYLKVYRAALG